MKFDVRIAFATVALMLGACQGGLDSGAGGMPGMMGPPVQQPGPMGTGEMQGPTIGQNGQPELTQPGATLAPNQSQFAVGDAPNGVKCPLFQQYTCTMSFNVPTPAPPPSPGQTPKPTPTPTATASSGSDDSDDSDSTSATPTPPGTITLQMEPLPNDVPTMTNPDPRLLRITPMVAIRLQSDTDFSLNGTAAVQYTIPKVQIATRSFAIQLYNETAIRGKRTDQYLATYGKYNSTDTTVAFNFSTPRVTVKRGQIWLLALYGFQYPPGATPTPSPTPASSGSPSPSPNPSPTPSG
jgi:hypothetical protein